MRTLGLLLLLFAGAVPAMDWQSASNLPNTHAASASERAAIVAELRNHLVVYNFEDDNPIQRHAGARCLQLGAMHVQGDLTATGLLMKVYNDFTFEVGGKLNARALLVSDKSADFTAGEVGASWTDDRDEISIGLALRRLWPELFTQTATLELEKDSDLTSLNFDYEFARERVSAGDTVFRSEPGDASLPQSAQAAIAPDSASADLAAPIGQDALIDQLIRHAPRCRKTWPKNS